MHVVEKLKLRWKRSGEAILARLSHQGKQEPFPLLSSLRIGHSSRTHCEVLIVCQYAPDLMEPRCHDFCQDQHEVLT